MKRIDPDELYPDTHRPLRRERRRLHARRSVTELTVAAADATSSVHAFADPDLQRLFERGAIDGLRRELKSGKEATVYLVDSRQGPLAAKVYADVRARSFKNDGRYRAGRFIGDVRAAKALEQRSGFGVEVQKALWVDHEYVMLWRLHDAGLPVPRPALGPEPIEYGAAGAVVLMEFLGAGDEPAPRLSDVRLQGDAARDAFEQSVEILARMLALGLVHGDYSTYNLLWHRERVVAIDFPQGVEIESNREAAALLERDAVSLCTSFRRHAVETDPAELLRRLAARRPR